MSTKTVLALLAANTVTASKPNHLKKFSQLLHQAKPHTQKNQKNQKSNSKKQTKTLLKDTESVMDMKLGTSLIDELLEAGAIQMMVPLRFDMDMEANHSQSPDADAAVGIYANPPTVGTDATDMKNGNSKFKGGQWADPNSATYVVQFMPDPFNVNENPQVNGKPKKLSIDWVKAEMKTRCAAKNHEILKNATHMPNAQEAGYPAKSGTFMGVDSIIKSTSAYILSEDSLMAFDRCTNVAAVRSWSETYDAQSNCCGVLHEACCESVAAVGEALNNPTGQKFWPIMCQRATAFPYRKFAHEANAQEQCLKRAQEHMKAIGNR